MLFCCERLAQANFICTLRPNVRVICLCLSLTEALLATSHQQQQQQQQKLCMLESDLSVFVPFFKAANNKLAHTITKPQRRRRNYENCSRLYQFRGEPRSEIPNETIIITRTHTHDRRKKLWIKTSLEFANK